MFHITNVIALVPLAKKSKDYFITMTFSNGDTKKMVLKADALASLLEHLKKPSKPFPNEDHPHASP